MMRFLKVILFLTAATVGAQDGTMMKSDKPAPNGAMMKASPTPTATDPSAFDLSGLGPQVTPFTTEAAAWKLAEGRTVVYFFAATWCPTCRAAYADLQAHFRELPPRVSLIFVNYDKSYDLKKKYGVTAQHTFVLIGPGGEKRRIWNGSATVAELTKALQAGS